MVMVDSIVNACIETYKMISKSGKPGPNEWTVISAIVGVFSDSDIRVLSMGTGSKCVGQSFMSPHGDLLNDSHAEVIARRAFLKYLYLEIIKFYETNSSDVFYQEVSDNLLLTVKKSVKFYFVTSMSPCGDASIMPKHDSNDPDNESLGCCLEISESSRNLLKRKHSLEKLDLKKLKTEHEITSESSDMNVGELETSLSLENKQGDIHRTGAKCLPNSSIQDPHLPGTLYHTIGAVRTKPGRGDPTLSLSCSDKIARWNAVGWQGALLSLLVKEPIFVDGIICGGGCPFSKDSFDRAVNKRINRKDFVPIHQSQTFFPCVKVEGKKPIPSSLIWCRGDGAAAEVAVNGRKQGVTKKNFNKKSSRTSICKKELFSLFAAVADASPDKEKFLEHVFGDSGRSLKDVTYGELKSQARQYQRKWEEVKKECFQVWSSKPADLLNFLLDR